MNSRLDTGDSPLRILHVIPSISKLNGGTTSALIRYLRAMKEDARLDVASTDWGLDETDRRSLASSLPRVQFHIFSSLGEHTRLFSLPLLRWLRREARNYDLVHAHSCLHPITAAAMHIARARCVPYVISPHGTLSEYAFSHRNRWNRHVKNLYFRLFERRLVNAAFGIHFTSTKEKSGAAFFHSNKSVVLIPIPVGVEELPNGPSNAKDGLSLLYLGRLHPTKGIELLIEAFQAIEEVDGRQVKLVIAGAGEKAYEDSLKDMVGKLGMAERVSFPGFVDGKKKKSLLAAADLFVLLSPHESFSVAVAEALAAGVPVLISEEVGLSDLVRAWQAGIVVRRDVEAIRVGFYSFFSDPNNMHRTRANARHLVVDCLSEEGARSGLMRLYRISTDGEKE